MERWKKCFKGSTYSYTKILRVSRDETSTLVNLSTNPCDVNQTMMYDQLVWGAIADKSDHGYMVDIGVRNCRCVLPFKQVEADTEYGK